MDTTRIRTAASGGTPAARAALAVFAGAGIVTALAGCTPAATQTSSPAASSPAAGSSTGATETTPSAAASESTSGSTSGSYKDGTYEATGGYTSPGGKEEVGVSITLTGGVVSAVTVTPTATSGNSAQYQKAFASGISGEVVGKNIDDLKVSKVSGSSLTSGGFNAAVETIKSEAKG